MPDSGPWYNLSVNLQPARTLSPGEIDALELVKALSVVFPEGELKAEGVVLQLVQGQFIFPNLAPAAKVNRAALSIQVTKENNHG